MIAVMLNSENHSVINDEQALGFNRGCESALAFFYHKLYSALVHYSNQITQNIPLSQEIASEAFVKVWRMHYKLDSYVGIKAYLYKIVHRDSIEAIVKENKRSKIYRIIPPETNTDSPFDNMVRSEVYRLIHTALKDLSPAARRVIIMYYFEDKNTGQISRELNLHPSTIKTQKTQGLKALKKVFINPLTGLFYFCIKSFPGF